MARWNDHSDVPVTCPLIDSVIDKLDTLKRDNLIDETEYKNLIDNLEAIREHNSTLRVWGNEQWKEAERLEVKNDNLLADIVRLEGEVQQLKDEVNSLNSTL